MYVGFINQTATSSEYPYPFAAIAGTSDKDRLWDETTKLTGGIVESIGEGTGDPQGPVFLRLPDGTWEPYQAEGSSGATTRNVEAEWGVYPFHAGSASGAAVVTNSTIVGMAWGTRPLVPISGVPGTQTVLLKPTPGTGDDYYWLVPPIIIRQETSGWPAQFNMYGEIDGVFWFHTGGNAIVSEDRFVLGTKRYSIFQNGNRTQDWSYFALDED